jgi:hypothetical protein
MNSYELSEVGVDCKIHAADDFVSRVLVRASRGTNGQTKAAFGPATVKIEVCGTVLASLALDPLRHAAIGAGLPTDFLLVMVDGKETGIDSPSLDRFAALHGGREQRADNGPRRSMLVVNEEWDTRCLIDENRRHAIVWFADAARIPEWVVYDQVRNVLHWLSYEGNFGLFHAAALRFEGVGCLIAGKSGSGKSTITAAAIAHGFDTAGDDFVLVESSSVPVAHTIFDTIKLDDKSLARVPQFRPFIRNPERRADEKAIVHLFDADRDRIASGFPLHVILRAQLNGKRHSRIAKTAPADVFRALAPSSLLLLRAQGKQVSANCAALVGRLGTYVFEIGTDVEAAVAELAGFMRTAKQ